MIFDVLGTPEDRELEFLDERTRSLIRHFKNKPPRHFKSMYPGADDSALELLRSLLQFNPNHRATAHQAMQHPYFKNMMRHSYLDAASSGRETSRLVAVPLNPDMEKRSESEENLRANVSATPAI